MYSKLSLYDLNKYKRTYQISIEDLSCCLLYFITGNKTFSYRNTKGHTSKAKHIDSVAIQFFGMEKIKFFMESEKENFYSIFSQKKLILDLERAKKDILNSKAREKRAPEVVKTKQNTRTKEDLINELNNDLDSETISASEKTKIRAQLIELEAMKKAEGSTYVRPIIYLPNRPGISQP